MKGSDAECVQGIIKIIEFRFGNHPQPLLFNARRGKDLLKFHCLRLQPTTLRACTSPSKTVIMEDNAVKTAEVCSLSAVVSKEM
jgi:hypothetical protein